MLTKRLFLVLLAMAPAAVIARGSTLPTITVSDPLAVTSGSSLDATVAVRDLLPTLGAFDITIGFDPAFLTPTDVTFFGMLGDPAAFEALTDFTIGPNTVRLSEVSLMAPADLEALQFLTPDFDLVKITFAGKKTGNTSLTVGGVRLVDEFGNVIPTVPEPGTAWTAVIALLALYGTSRRRRHRRAGVPKGVALDQVKRS